MCQKALRIWSCGCTYLEDPRRCRRNKTCDSYPYVWAFRDPVTVPSSLKCPSCIAAAQFQSRQQADQAFIATSSAYPTLKEVQSQDDSKRVKAGRPVFNRTASSREVMVLVPTNSTSDMNRLPSNANEFSAFLTGGFDTLRKLPDTHMPSGTSSGGLQENTTHPHGYRLRLPPPPSDWQGGVLLDDDEYPFVRFRQRITHRPESIRRPSYTSDKSGEGWAPPDNGILPPKSDVGNASSRMQRSMTE